MNRFRMLMGFAALVVTLAVLFGYRSARADHESGYYDGSPPRPTKMFFDVNQTDPAMMRDYLTVINSTYDTLVSKGVPSSRIHLVLSLRGLTVTFATRNFGAGTANEQTGEQIRAQLSALLNKQVRIEACAISLQWMGVSEADLLSGIAVIDNAFIESAWYQSHGYAAISLFQP